ncbi:luciferin 4-monooxygenase-like [Bicyclus anynana]|uniref:Luciferin 4-monooxygenase-like n=1 Tax=Bicyclus anynana TaxID=110368 RepID=A0ABM3LF88_BICAN|nr:luciferin 4-monooxygenase-like [Bicyclus anynana]
MFAEQIKNGIIYGDQNFFVPPHLNFGAFVLEKILKHNDKVALINGETGVQITFREMVQKIVNIASALTDLGVEIGDVVAIASENRLEYFVSSIAVYCCGGISTFFNNAYTKNELTHAINISKPKFIFVSGEVFKKHRETLRNIDFIKKFILYDEMVTSNDCIHYRELAERYVDVNTYKSVDYKGTTGSAKGAKITHLNLIVACQQPQCPHIKHLLQAYGITEATGAVTREMETAPKEGSVGPVVPGIIIKVVDPETNKILGVGEPGEVRISGPAVFDGYIGKDKKDDFDEEGFYKTGDIAYYDKDGYFYIVDRIKEIIKYKAWQVPPSELEGLLLQHPSIKEAGVTGTPDLLAGELPTAFVVKQQDAKVTEQEIIDYISDKVAPWKKLRGGVIFVDEVPKTPSGKILRRKLKALLQSVQKIPASKL